MCGGLYKEYYGSIVTWSGMDPDTKMNYFTWYRKDNEWVVTGEQYNKKY